MNQKKWIKRNESKHVNQKKWGKRNESEGMNQKNETKDMNNRKWMTGNGWMEMVLEMEMNMQIDMEIDMKEGSKEGQTEETKNAWVSEQVIEFLPYLLAYWSTDEPWSTASVSFDSTCSSGFLLQPDTETPMKIHMNISI